MNGKETYEHFAKKIKIIIIQYCTSKGQCPELFSLLNHDAPTFLKRLSITTPCVLDIQFEIGKKFNTSFSYWIQKLPRSLRVLGR